MGRKISSGCKTLGQPWENIKTFFQFSEEIRTIIYPNAEESLHRQFRKVTKTRSVLPTDESLYHNLQFYIITDCKMSLET